MNRQGQVRTRSHVQRKASTTPPIQKSFFWERPFANPQHGNPDLPQQEPTQTSRSSVPALSRAKIDIDRPIPIQPKLTVGAPNDQYEQEADRVAAQVMSTPDAAVQQPIQREAKPDEEELQTKPLAASITPLVQREMMPEEEEPVQAKLSNSIQREELPEEEEPVQAKLDSIQREEMPEEEEVQAKAIDSIQREEMPEEEEVQAKPLGGTLQREEMPEEEEIQTKPLGSIQREEMPEEEEVQTKPALQRVLRKASPTTDGGLQAGGSIESQLNSSKGGGEPLSDEVRSFMEPRFGADFRQVRVHTGSEAVQMNRDLNAQAFTHKQDVYFGAGKAPAKDALTAHELTHVVQQTEPVLSRYSPNDAKLSSILQRDGSQTKDQKQKDQPGEVPLFPFPPQLKDGQWYFTHRVVAPDVPSSSFWKASVYNSRNNNYNAYTTIAQRHAFYRFADAYLNTQDKTIRSRWFDAAAEVTGNFAVGAAEGINLWFLHDNTEKFLKAGNEFLFQYNMKNFSYLMQGQDIPGMEGLRGKDLDYKLVEFEQGKVGEFIKQYKGSDLNAMVKEINASFNLYFAPNLIRSVLKKEFEDKGIEFNFNDYTHRVTLGQKMIDGLR